MLAHRALGRSPDAQSARGALRVSTVALAGSYGISAEDTVRGFHELGVSTFFVSPRARGVIEGVRRLVADGHRDRLTLVSVASIPFGFSVRYELKRMLKALGVESIDVYLLAWVQAHWYVTGNTWSSMVALKESGATRALGISCHDRKMARSLVDELALDVVMLRYNAAHRGAEREVFDSLDPSDRPGVIAYTATRWGKLLQSQGELGPMTAGECYQFALGHPTVDTVLCGARNFEELSSNVRAVLDGPLPETRLSEVKRFGDAVRAKVSSRIAFAGG